jgi:type II secretory pathway component PulF
MNYDELAFFNQQLAAMLRDGIPLEGALQQLSAGMNAGAFRGEMEQLQADLARGTPLVEALGRRQLPAFYVRMIELGVRSNDLPGVLTLLADYYLRANTLSTRLKGLMVYPFIVVIISLGLTGLLSVVFRELLSRFFQDFGPLPPLLVISMWIPPVLLTLAVVIGFLVLSRPIWRGRLRWRLPAFREASLAQLASALALMMKNGTTLPEALSLAEGIESNTPAAQALAEWRRLVESGQGKPSQWPTELKPFPPMFLWLVQKGGEDVAAGFQKAADLYHVRAAHRIEMALYGVLPVSILFLGQMVLLQIAPMMRSMIWFMNVLSGNME